MPEFIDIGLKRAAITLAEELDYVRAGERLNITGRELRKQIHNLETQLCLHLFKPRVRKVELTDDGRFLIKVFREAVSVHDRSENENMADR